MLYAVKSRKEVVSLLLNEGFSLNVRDNREVSPSRGSSASSITYFFDEPSYEVFSSLETMGWQEGVDKIIWQELGSVYKTTDNLRLRSSEGTCKNQEFSVINASISAIVYSLPVV